MQFMGLNNMSQPVISVIVPIYKVEKYLCQCVESILNQSYRNIELILVDDGSPDACPRICDEYALADPRVKVIHKENGGVSSARKVGMESASGNYVLFVDSDDWLSLETLQCCMDRIEDADCLIFSYVREYPDSSLPAHVLDTSCVMEGAEAEDRIYRRLFGLVGDELRHPERLENMGSCVMKLYRRETAKQGRFFDASEIGSSEDTLFNMYALFGCRKVVYLDEPLYHYRKAGSSITSSYRPRLIEQWGRLFDLMEAVIEEKQLGSDYRQAMDARIALSVFGIGSNELSADDGFFSKVGRIREYISTDRYVSAVYGINISKMPLPWKALLFFAKHKMSLALCAELYAIQSVRNRL